MTRKTENLGVSFGVFCMAFIFTKDGTRVVTGSIDRINDHTNSWPPCHAMVHWYCKDILVKEWKLLGRDCRLFLCQERVGERIKWVLFDRAIPGSIGSWRKLPSCHLRQLRAYERGNPQDRELKGGLG